MTKVIEIGFTTAKQADDLCRQLIDADVSPFSVVYDTDNQEFVAFYKIVVER